MKFSCAFRIPFLRVPFSVNCNHFRVQMNRNGKLLTTILLYDTLPTKPRMALLHLLSCIDITSVQTLLAYWKIVKYHDPLCTGLGLRNKCASNYWVLGKVNKITGYTCDVGIMTFISTKKVVFKNSLILISAFCPRPIHRGSWCDTTYYEGEQCLDAAFEERSD